MKTKGVTWISVAEEPTHLVATMKLNDGKTISTLVMNVCYDANSDEFYTIPECNYIKPFHVRRYELKDYGYHLNYFNKSHAEWVRKRDYALEKIEEDLSKQIEELLKFASNFK